MGLLTTVPAPAQDSWPSGIYDQYTWKLHELFPDVPYGEVDSPPLVDNFLNNITVPPYFGGNARGEGVAVGSPEWNAASYAQKFAVMHDKYQVLHGGQGFSLADIGKGWQAATTSWSAFGDFMGTLGLAAADAIHDTAVAVARTVDNWLCPPAYGDVINPGGVLIDKAATLVGTNIHDITGSTLIR